MRTTQLPRKEEARAHIWLLSHCHYYYPRMKEDGDKFLNYCLASFDELLEILRSTLTRQDIIMRTAVTPEKKISLHSSVSKYLNKY